MISSKTCVVNCPSSLFLTLGRYLRKTCVHSSCPAIVILSVLGGKSPRGVETRVERNAAYSRCRLWGRKTRHVVLQLPNHNSLALMEHQSALRRTASLSMIWRQDGVIWLVGSSPQSCMHSRDPGQRRKFLQPIRPRRAHSQKHTEHTSLFPLANGDGHAKH